MFDALLIDIAIFLLYGLLIFLIFVVATKRSDRVIRIVFINLMIMYVLILLVSSFFPTKMSSGDLKFLPLESLFGAIKTKNLFMGVNWFCHMSLNILLYMPMGVILLIIFKLQAYEKSLLMTFVIAAVVTILIELLQGLFVTYRALETDDVIFGILGALLGWIILNKQSKQNWFKVLMTDLLP